MEHAASKLRVTLLFFMALRLSYVASRMGRIGEMSMPRHLEVRLVAFVQCLDMTPALLDAMPNLHSNMRVLMSAAYVVMTLFSAIQMRRDLRDSRCRKGAS